MSKADDFPLIDGHYKMTEEWSIFLPQPVHRRVEDGSLVLWRPGLTLWINMWGNDTKETADEQLARIRSDRSPDCFNEIYEEEDGLLRLSYRLQEDTSDERVAAFYGFVVGVSGHVQMAVYFDEEDTLQLAEGLWRSVMGHQ